MKIVFLDIDGVLYKAPTNGLPSALVNDWIQKLGENDGNTPWDYAAASLFDPTAMAFLDRLLAEVPDARIVLHSSWRTKGYEALKDMFATHRFANRMIDVTSPKGSKERSIDLYLQTHPEVDSFVILEDQELDVHPTRQVLCQDRRLFGETEFLKALSLLSTKPP